MSRRVVITGMGIISCIGNDKNQVLDALQQQRSGISYVENYKEQGLKSHIAGRIKDVDTSAIDRKLGRFMSISSTYAYLSMLQSIEDAGLTKEDIAFNDRVGVIAGTGGPSPTDIFNSHNIYREKKTSRSIGPYLVPKVMTSSASATLATGFKVQGLSYSVSSACSTSTNSIGLAYQAIQSGSQDMIFAGGSEEESWELSLFFDAMGALSKRNDAPETASRPFSKTRDGFVIAGGGGMLLLEDYEHAKKRGAKIYAEVIGFGIASDGGEMVAPSGEGSYACMRNALKDAKIDASEIDYINVHATSTPVGDAIELKALERLYGSDVPKFSATKSLTGHSLGACGVQEAIYSLLMMENKFITGSMHVDDLEDNIPDSFVRTNESVEKMDCIMSTNYGFGGNNVALIFRKL